MEIFFAPILFFLIHPERITVLAALFFVASIGSSVAERRAWPTAFAGAGWALYAMWELHCKKQGYNIRIDLILIAPVLFVLTGWGLISLVQPRKAESSEG